MELPRRNALSCIARHPAGAVLAGALFAIAAGFFVRGSMAAHERIALADDPVVISDQALAQAFDRGVAEREINAALAAGDVDLAQSFVALAADRNVPIDAALPGKVKEVEAEQSTLPNTAGRFVHGLWTGEPSDLASLAGTAFGDLFVFGDIRDAAREGTRYLTGQTLRSVDSRPCRRRDRHHCRHLCQPWRDDAGTRRPVACQSGAADRTSKPGACSAGGA